MFAFPVWVRGNTPETPIFPFTRAYLHFFVQKESFLLE
ncbi:hypothetical protein BREVNS_1352 [Brevinematales bacterium NS]|nr:hypothetical protein BREVNS_1352 [Brevinematales bacterium NS]